MPHFKDRRGLTLVELFIVFCIIVILLGVFGFYFGIVLDTARETALRNELYNIRMAIEHYRIASGSYPESLSILTNKKFTISSKDGIIQSAPYLKPSQVDKNGQPLDPFAREYYYDSKNGKIASRLSRYKGW